MPVFGMSCGGESPRMARRTGPCQPSGRYSNRSTWAVVVVGRPLLVAYTPIHSPRKPPVATESKARPSTQQKPKGGTRSGGGRKSGGE